MRAGPTRLSPCLRWDKARPGQGYTLQSQDGGQQPAGADTETSDPHSALQTLFLPGCATSCNPLSSVCVQGSLSTGTGAGTIVLNEGCDFREAPRFQRTTMSFPITPPPPSASLSRRVFVSGQWGAGEAGQAPGQLPVAARLFGSTLTPRSCPPRLAQLLSRAPGQKARGNFPPAPLCCPLCGLEPAPGEGQASSGTWRRVPRLSWVISHRTDQLLACSMAADRVSIFLYRGMQELKLPLGREAHPGAQQSARVRRSLDSPK